MSPFADTAIPTRSADDTRRRTSAEYVRFDESYRTVLRVLNTHARSAWKHWIPQANRGKGMSAICPNISAQLNVCPIDVAVAHLPKDNPERINARARKKFIVNVLDRTPYTTCPNCQTNTPGKVCISCKADLKGVDYKPLNKVKILESGPQLFNDLNAIERMQQEDFKAEITDYDLTFTTNGKGRDRQVKALTQPVGPLPEDALLNESGEPQSLYDLDALTEPDTIEEINLKLQGKSIDEINAERGLL